MNEKKSTVASRGTKHGLDPISSKFSALANKKRRIVELTIDQHLAPGLRDSFFGKLTEEVMFNILEYLSRNSFFCVWISCSFSCTPTILLFSR